MKRKTNEEFQQEVFSLVGDDYTFLDKYVNAKDKIRVKHNKCNCIYSVSPTNFIKGSRCPYCSGNHKKTDDEFRKEIQDLVGTEYRFLDKYVNDSTKLRVKHNWCGNIYEVKPTNFLSGKRCPYCYGNRKKTDKEFNQEVFDLVGDEYTFLDDYVNDYTKLKVKHNQCENTYEVSPSSFLQGHGCPYCFGKHKKSNEQFQQEVYDLVGNEYTFLDKYINTDTKLRIKHNRCENIYEVKPSNFLFGYRCPYCNSPKGETVITKLLDTFSIEYEYQKTFPDLKDKSYLSYDFYIPDQNILIEYQGIQHYQPVDHFGGDDRFMVQQKHDQTKLDYAKEHGYNLIAVPYTEDTFSKIKRYLIKHGLK